MCGVTDVVLMMWGWCGDGAVMVRGWCSDGAVMVLLEGVVSYRSDGDVQHGQAGAMMVR